MGMDNNTIAPSDGGADFYGSNQNPNYTNEKEKGGYY